MDAEPCRFRHGIDQMAKRSAGSEDEVVPLGEMARRDQAWIEPLQRTGDGLGLQAGGVHEIAAMERQGSLASHLQAKAVIGEMTAGERAPQGQHGARRLRIALEGQHQPMAVDDAGGGRQEGRHRPEVRLEGVDGGRIEPGQILDAIGRRLPPQRRQRRNLVLPAGDDQLAQAAMLDAMLAAIVIEHVAAGDAEPGLQAAGGVVDAGMDHLAVARGDLAADVIGGFQYQGLAPGLGQGARDGEPHHAGADDNGFHAFGHAPGRCGDGLSPSSRARRAASASRCTT